jgi:hypothetical protein
VLTSTAKKLTMKKDEATLNEFERAVLNHMRDQLPALSPTISELRLSHRELTGVGSFTNFANHDAKVPVPTDGPLALDVHILMPGVQNGLGALLFFNADSITSLEIFTYGDDGWSGNWEGFSFAEHGSKKGS